MALVMDDTVMSDLDKLDPLTTGCYTASDSRPATRPRLGLHAE
jgi:hypothetical protein